MKFGLITGSTRAIRGWRRVLRRTVSSIANEINTADGAPSTQGDGHHRDTESPARLPASAAAISTTAAGMSPGPITAGECQMWGNPIGEMMYEGLRYFAGKQAPTASSPRCSVLAKRAHLPGAGPAGCDLGRSLQLQPALRQAIR